jgi:hypothetical protein
MSGRTYEKAKAVVAAAEREPTRFGPVAEEMDPSGKVDPAYRKVSERKERPRETASAPAPPFRWSELKVHGQTHRHEARFSCLIPCQRGVLCGLGRR